MSAPRLVAVALVLGASHALAQEPDSPWEARLGVGARPLLAFSALSLYKTATIRDGGWISVDAVPAYRFSRHVSAELGLSALVPLQDAWGYPDFRLALTPAARLDAGPVYARLGVPLMVGGGVHLGVQAAAGATFLGAFYAGVVAEALPGELLGGLGLEVGVRFGAPRER